MPKKILLGEFSTNGQLYATDPYYEIGSDGVIKLKVKAGTYQVFLTYGKLKKPLFNWDRNPGNFRNARLTIVHKAKTGPLKFVNQGTIGVDSGQAGFFNRRTYQQDFAEAVELRNSQVSSAQESLSQTYSELRLAQDFLKKISKNPSANERFQRMQKIFKKSEQETLDYFKNDAKTKKEVLEELKQEFKTKNFDPNYYPIEKSKKWYEFICDLARGYPANGGAYEQGAVCHSGLGDGGSPLLVARNQQKEIVAATINFLHPSDLK